MGIAIHTLNTLRYCANKKKFGKTATLGRQRILLDRMQIKKILNIEEDFGVFCEELLKQVFLATKVDSYDFSEYENATHIYDFNQSLTFEDQYDTVIDLGCSEHIFNIANVLANISKLCKIGGQIIHALPANNFCGHGFWQFSPELFYSLYNSKNGYDKTEMFLADLSDESYWYKIKPFVPGERVNILSNSSVYIIIRTVKISDFSHNDIQQSDYQFEWSKEVSTNKQKLIKPRYFLKTLIRKLLQLIGVWQILGRGKLQFKLWQARQDLFLTARNKKLVKCKISDLIS